MNGTPKARDLVEYFSDKSEDTVYRWIKKYGYSIDKNSGAVTRKTDDGE